MQDTELCPQFRLLPVHYRHHLGEQIQTMILIIKEATTPMTKKTMMKPSCKCNCDGSSLNNYSSNSLVIR